MEPVDDDDISDNGDERQSAAIEAAEQRHGRERDNKPVDMAALWREAFSTFAADFSANHGLAQQAFRADLATLQNKKRAAWWDSSWIRAGTVVCSILAGTWFVSKEALSIDNEVRGFFNSFNERMNTVSTRADSAGNNSSKALEWINTAGKEFGDKVRDFDYRIRTLENNFGQLTAIVTHNREERVAQIDEIRKDKEGVNVRLGRIEQRLEDLISTVSRLEEKSRSERQDGRSIRPTATPPPPKRSPPLQDATDTSPP